MEKINRIFIDVDGTMTDGKIYLDNTNNEYKAFNVKDGLMIAAAIKYGYQLIIMTGRESKVVARRAAELGIEECYQGIKNKKEALEKIMAEKNFSYNNLAYLGDDLNDLAVMKKAAFTGCPADAAAEVKNISDFVSRFEGGNNAVREILTALFKAKGEYQKVLAKYL